jgi:hypothetical protein
MNDIVGGHDLHVYDASRYDGWTLENIITGLRGATLPQLKRGSLTSLLARREWGGLLVAASRLVITLAEQTSLFRRVVDLAYPDARLHMKLWIFWPRVVKVLQDHEESCRKRGVPFIVPGYRRCLRMAGVIGKLGPAIPVDPSPPLITGEPLPTDVVALRARVERLELQNRLEREKSTLLTVELDETKEELAELKAEQPKPNAGSLRSLGGWFGAKEPPRRPALIKPDRPAQIEVRIGNCLDLIEQQENVYDAIVTDPPYALALHGYDWDSDISFMPALWERFLRVLKPGGYIAFFAAPRLYHRAATAGEQAGFTLYPFMGWRFRDGLPKPINLAELFDRDNVAERDVIGIRRGSGFTQANVDHGAQNRSHVDFAVHERHVSPEAQAWRGYYYGVNALKPCLEPILLAQKPISTDRVVDNIRLWGTGALNIGALPCRIAMAPGRVLCFPTARRKSRSSI